MWIELGIFKRNYFTSKPILKLVRDKYAIEVLIQILKIRFYGRIR